jgi:hypothetical protein
MYKGINEGESVPDFLTRMSGISDNDGNYLKSVLKLKSKFNVDPISIFVHAGRRMFVNTFDYKVEPQKSPFGTFHNGSGIVSLCNNIYNGVDSYSFTKGAKDVFIKSAKNKEAAV